MLTSSIVSKQWAKTSLTTKAVSRKAYDGEKNMDPKRIGVRKMYSVLS